MQINKRLGIAVCVVLVIAALAGGAWYLWRAVPGGKPAPKAMTMSAAVTDHPAASGAADAESDVTIPTESLARMQLKFGEVTEGRLGVAIRVPGTVQSNGYREVHVTPLVGGTVISVSAEPGQTVKRGQAMARVFSSDLADAQMSFITLNVELEAEHKKLVRTQELVRLGAASREELETVQAAHEVHEVHVGAARQKLLLLGLKDAQIASLNTGRQVDSHFDIPAPIDGTVIVRNMNPGQVVSLGQDLFTVTDLSNIWVEANLFEKDFASVRLGSLASVTTPAYVGRVYKGAVSYVDPKVDPQTRTAKVRVVIANTGLTLRLGMYVDVLFGTTSGKSSTVVPAKAIQLVGADRVVYIPAKGEEGRFLQRTIRTGEETEDGLQVLEGLKQGDKVVTEGSFLLRAEAIRQHAP